MILHPIIQPAGSAAGVTLVQTCNLRLSLSASDPVPASDIAAATTLHALPFAGNQVALHDGSGWQIVAFTSASLSTTALTADKPHDVFAYLSGGTLALEALAWTDDATRATALASLDGVPVKSGDSTRRYLGSFVTFDHAGTVSARDSAEHRCLFNAQHQQLRPLYKNAGISAFTQNPGGTPARYNNNDDLRVEVMIGQVVTVRLMVSLSPTINSGEWLSIGWMVDSTTTLSTIGAGDTFHFNNAGTALQWNAIATLAASYSPGRHTFVPAFTSNATIDFSGSTYDRVDGAVML